MPSLLLKPRFRCTFSPREIEQQQQISQMQLQIPSSPPSSSSRGDISSPPLDPLNLVLHRTLSLSSPITSANHVSWRKRLEDLLWTASAAFIVYYGDFQSNLLTILAFDLRVSRVSFNLGLLCLLLILAILMYLSLRGHKTSSKRIEETVVPAAVPTITLIGLAAYILFSHALWPIWNLLTLPMLFTLFMAIVVIVPYLVPHILYSCPTR